jgi:hypothetical protein
VPPGIEGSGQDLSELLARLCGPGRGLELVSRVNDIPKGSRLAVSTNLLASLIAACMRATRQAASLEGPLRESERRLVLARAILGEWLGGSGGGWQDSGGVWPGMKLITGVIAGSEDPEWGISRGCLMPQHRILDLHDVSPKPGKHSRRASFSFTAAWLKTSVPFSKWSPKNTSFGPPQNGRPANRHWDSWRKSSGLLRRGDIAAVGAATTRNFKEPIQTIIPWASNAYTETLIRRAQTAFASRISGDSGCSAACQGGGMGFIVAPQRRRRGPTTAPGDDGSGQTRV